MIAAIDIGNSFMEIGVFEGDELLFSTIASSRVDRTTADWAVYLRQILDLYGVRAADLKGAILDSVVPSLTRPVTEALTMISGVKPLVVGPGLKSGLKIAIDDPKQLGGDMAAAAVGALKRYESPLIVVNIGTATTFSILDEKGSYIGGIIMPGFRTSYAALARATAQLPSIAFRAPGRVVGTNTVSAMESGAVNGHASMIDGMLDRVEEETGVPIKNVIMTGPESELIAGQCRREITVDQSLMMTGLKEIYDRQSKKRR